MTDVVVSGMGNLKFKFPVVLPLLYDGLYGEAPPERGTYLFQASGI